MTFKSILSEVQIAELILDYKDGWTVNECSVIYRVSERTVYRLLALHNVPKKGSRKHRKRPRIKEAKSKELLPCGTNAGYERHRRAKEYPCSACLDAHSKSVKMYRLRSIEKKRSRPKQGVK